ncbi:CDP-glycerol glycerophosphotransferase family protein [Cryobacterium sp. Y50]|uniref:CDP-glycerol glycerophosphotransferase family protein n=1 Tax=Cryobacterium sp. Y50 TaxID=2048286 RepID=UPI0021007606|nr:CDP-glycerol glycerophosphotransferase family protein [Cryobacterium sp. Y50]
MSSPKARGIRLHVHLTHGLGPKRYISTTSSELTWISASTVWNGLHLLGCHASDAEMLLSGLPRQDSLTSFRPDRLSRLRLLGLDPDLPFVVWVPTYRSTKGYGLGTQTVEEGTPFNATRLDNRPSPIDLLTQAKAANVQLVAKPHPIDADRLEKLGIRSITNSEIWSAGLSVYEFLGLSTGMVSDYSSIWIDYLETGRSIGLFCPDYEAFASSRGMLTPDLSEVAGRLFLDSHTTLSDFFREIANGGVFRQSDLRECRERIGFVERKSDRTRAQSLVDELSHRYSRRIDMWN